jgi:hypothetical protein
VDRSWVSADDPHYVAKVDASLKFYVKRQAWFSVWRRVMPSDLCQSVGKSSQVVETRFKCGLVTVYGMKRMARVKCKSNRHTGI